MLTFITGFLIALFSSLALTPAVRNGALRLGLLDRPDGLRKIHGTPVPRLGGVPILLALLISLCAVYLIPLESGDAVRQYILRAASIFGLGTLMMLIGLLDDLKTLVPWQKLSAQTLVAALAWLSGLRILGSWSTDGGIIELGILSLPITLIWIVGITNAFNLIDGIDGLSAGAALLAMFSMIAVSAYFHQWLSVLLLSSLAGAVLGFLRYNFMPATIFLGDSGSLLLGFMLAVLGIESSQKSTTAFAIAVPIVALGLPLLDTVISVVRRFLSGKPILTGDRRHIHHILMARGLTPKHVVILLYGVCGLFGLISLLFMNPRGRTMGLSLALLGACVWIGIRELKYPELTEFHGYLGRALRHQRELIAGNVVMGKMIAGFQQAKSLPDLLASLGATLEELEFSRAEIRLPSLKENKVVLRVQEWKTVVDGRMYCLYQWFSSTAPAGKKPQAAPASSQVSMGHDFRLEFVFKIKGEKESEEARGLDIGRLTFYHPMESQFPVSAICLLSRNIWGEFAAAIQRIMEQQNAGMRQSPEPTAHPLPNPPPAAPNPSANPIGFSPHSSYHFNLRLAAREPLILQEERRMSLFRRFIIVALALLPAAGLLAEQGMWMPQQIPQLAAQLRALGFKGDPNAFADLTGQPMGAIVSLGGCTASFISPDGLIVTNHHCVTGGLQYNSTPQRNLLADGYLAATRDRELSTGPGQHVYVTTSVVEVTKEITGSIDPKATDRQRNDTIDRRIKERIAACEKDGLRCNVAAFFEGLRYFEIAQLDIKDVRLVYAPAEGIGVFGGETDNWRWPRHTGDWSYLRAYVSTDGKSVPYAKDNVPYKPKHWLQVSAQGANPGDLVFVVGYPGRTQRYQTYAEVKETAEWAFPRAIRLAQEQLALIDTLIAGNKDLELKVSSRTQSLNNNMTNQKGMLEGLVKGGALAQKLALEKDLAAWIAANPARKQKYGDVLPALQAMHAEGEMVRERNAVLTGLSSASNYLSAAQALYRLSIQRPKKDIDREAGFQERDWSRIRDTQDRLQRTIDPTVDRAFLRWALGLAIALPAGQRIEPLDNFLGTRAGMPKAEADKAVEGHLDRLYAGTKLNDRDFRLGLLEKSTAELMATRDSFFLLAATLEPLAESIREAGKDRAGASARLRPRYMEALLEKAGGLVAPDANSTLRVTYGQIKGVDAKDGLSSKPQTGLKGIIEKQTGEGEFNAPKKQIDAIQNQLAGRISSAFTSAALKDVPVNFLSTVDTTGGNSGSPTLNGKGELVGLLFDGTYESVASNFLFDPVKTRSIHVDSRYMLWNMHEVDGAHNLLKEMGIIK